RQSLKMSQPQWEKAKQIFNELSGAPISSRTALLQQACGGDATLRASVEKLLSAHERAGEFLREPTLNAGTIIRVVEQSGMTSATRDSHARQTRSVAAADVREVGRRIGRYKLLEVIGEGGFGTVYMAEQVEPVRRRVALKIIKPGMDSR